MRLSVIKKDSSREPYERQKLINGLQKSCYKRPVTAEQILNIVDLTEEEIFRNYDRDVPSQFIGDTASYHLAKLDKIAYVRFASVYREFQDVGQLINEAEVIKNTPKVGPQQDGLFTDV